MGTCATTSNKSVRRYADGGSIGNAIDVLSNRKAVIDAAVNGATSPPPQPIAVLPKPSMGSEAESYAAQAAAIEAEQQAAAKARLAAPKPKTFLNRLGFANGGKIKGPGTPTSDSIAAQIRSTGEPIAVSTGERILSAAQDSYLQKIAQGAGFESLDSMLEAGTGKPVGPTIKGGKAAAARGLSLAFPDTSKALSDTNQAIANAREQGNYGAMVGQSLRGVVPAASGLINDTIRSAAHVIDPAANALKTAVTGNNEPANATTPASIEDGMQERSFVAPKTQGIADLPDPPTPPDVSGAQERTFAAQSSNAPFKQRIGNSFTERNTVMDQNNPLTSIDMAGNNASMAKANAIRQSMIDGGGTGPKVTTLEDSGRKDSQALMDKWGREDAAKSAMDAAIANPKSAQAIASILGATTQNDASRNRDAVDLLTRGEANITNRRGQDISAGIASEGHSVTARGQDIGARTAANQLAGNPLSNDLIKTQTAVAQSGLDDKKRNAAIIDEINRPETTPERREILHNSLMASLGKNASERYVPQTEKTYNEMGQITGETAMMFDPQTKQYIVHGQSPGLPAPKSEAEMKALPKGARYTAPDGSVRIKP